MLCVRNLIFCSFTTCSDLLWTASAVILVVSCLFLHIIGVGSIKSWGWERCLQGFGCEARRQETTGKTKA